MAVVKAVGWGKVPREVPKKSKGHMTEDSECPQPESLEAIECFQLLSGEDSAHHVFGGYSWYSAQRRLTTVLKRSCGVWGGTQAFVGKVCALQCFELPSPQPCYWSGQIFMFKNFTFLGH